MFFFFGGGGVECFPFFPKEFRGSPGKKNPCFFTSHVPTESKERKIRVPFWKTTLLSTPEPVLFSPRPIELGMPCAELSTVVVFALFDFLAFLFK